MNKQQKLQLLKLLQLASAENAGGFQFCDYIIQPIYFMTMPDGVEMDVESMKDEFETAIEEITEVSTIIK